MNISEYPKSSYNMDYFAVIINFKTINLPLGFLRGSYSKYEEDY